MKLRATSEGLVALSNLVLSLSKDGVGTAAQASSFDRLRMRP
jgi:hypothetical protein